MSGPDILGSVSAGIAGVCAVRGWYLVVLSGHQMSGIHRHRLIDAAFKWFALGAFVGLSTMVLLGVAR